MADPVALNGALLRIPTDQVEPGPNARGAVGNVQELAVSLAALGQQIPLIVEQLAEHHYRVIDGHRRLAAAKLAGLPHVDAVLRRTPGEAERLARQLAMHAQSRPFEPIAEAKALHRLMWEYRLDRDRIAALIGKGPGWVRDRLALLNLSEEEQAAVQARQLPLGQAAGIVRERRAERSGHSAPRATSTRRPRIREEHFTTKHPLANDAVARCYPQNHRQRLLVGGIACGECWEAVIRADERGSVRHG